MVIRVEISLNCFRNACKKATQSGKPKPCNPAPKSVRCQLLIVRTNKVKPIWFYNKLVSTLLKTFKASFPMTNYFFTRHCVHFCTTCSFRICKIFLLSNFAGYFISSFEKGFLVRRSFEIQDAIICWISGYFCFGSTVYFSAKYLEIFWLTYIWIIKEFILRYQH